MKKITTFCLLLTFLLCLVFTGCGNADAGAVDEDLDKAVEDVTVHAQIPADWSPPAAG